jgi:DNA repair protein RadA/Sms
MPEVDEVLGGGLVPGQAILLAGEPGIGKSTLLLQLAGMAAGKARSLYVSAEESLPQLADRAARLGLPAGDIRALATARADDALAVLQGPEPPDFLVLDSVQTMAVDELDGLPGSVSQVRAVAAATVEAAKRSGAVLLLVGHVTKEGQIAGPKLLEHMVDTVLSLEGDRNHVFRVLRVLKNRFGPGQETLVLSMDGAGLKPVSDPSAYFLEDRDAGVSGSAVVMTAEGRRPFAVEVQALASRSFLSIPRRTALGFDANRLNLLLAVMEKRLKLSFAQADIYAKTGGGLRVADPGLDLGICASVLSSFYDLPLPAEAVFWGEVDLSGRARPVNGGDLRARQAEKLGYGRVYSSDTCRDLAELQRKLFGKG